MGYAISASPEQLKLMHEWFGFLVRARSLRRCIVIVQELQVFRPDVEG
jgi:hypothetical protein